MIIDCKVIFLNSQQKSLLINFIICGIIKYRIKIYDFFNWAVWW